MEHQYLNVAAYAFFKIENLTDQRDRLLNFCTEKQLRGSILLAEEGMNLYVCGLSENIENLQDYLHKELNVPQMEYKQSWSDFQPFRRMLVKIKNEIITMKQDDIKPEEHTGPRLSPKEFKKWLDENRDIYVLDTRNDYEIKHGKFEQAQHLDVKSFTEFAEKAQELDENIKEKPVVMYCTGGIRCEKASSLFLKNYGFKEVYQLEGGILKYFEECGGEHYDGDCFVFDDRICVDNRLQTVKKNES
ncbi:rhodanese-related sulfurtransferase [Candidatus Uabimicrobium sp. HlEnr_7]|uniref:oxygen-dependent tRNA uridine(34) hydroxylase TrhO n=1 Tax=Candidatus Uabimicrobium helgolandensis TaxID=3095367 RepID=UPI0035583AEB